jgi:hypothetical protein
MKFSSFIDIKNKKITRELGILKEVLSKNFDVKSFFESEHPYIYIKSKIQDLSFDGVRIYKIGSNWAYRVQNESDKEPYGKAYPLDIEKMFEELVPDMSEEEAGETIAEALADEFSKFFDKSSTIQKEIGIGMFDSKDITNQPVVGSNSGDFSNSIYK